ncbi:MAG: type II toxin-antitoxin system Phd/YefM family antitoxin [Polyangiaceae bacterium]|nr:type II toxin-antitoxin system Phd/YefM family antitoxin [Polyangiaceae bacterium]MBK8939823.1 type II toxin-antitoxin system Phd/YefM family antitoxin [Polyangiaceae bacterium]
MNRSGNSPIPALQVAEDIVPIGELKAHLSEKIRALRGRRRPLVVTQNGKAAAVMLAPEDFDRLTTQARFVAAVQDGLNDLDAGRVVSDEDLGRRLDARFGALSKPTNGSQ